jgi:hypothetical protein
LIRSYGGTLQRPGLPKIFKDHTIRSRPADTGCIAALHEARDAPFQRPKLAQLGTDHIQMALRKIASFRAGTIPVLHERNKRSHLFDREAEVAAPAYEGETLDVFVAIAPLTTIATTRPRQDADLLVVADRRRIRAGPLCQRSDLQVRHCSIPSPSLLNFKLLEVLSLGQSKRSVPSALGDLEGGSKMTAAAPKLIVAACALAPEDFQDRIALIGDLNRDALRSQRRDGFRLELVYAPAALDRVREMVAREQDCCAFLSFDMREEKDAIRLIIEAPESARDALDAVFEPFQAREPATSVCGCSPSVCK